MNKTILLLGGNIGNTLQIFESCKAILSKKLGTIEKQSSLYESAPWGFEHQNNFYNQVLLIQSEYSPTDVLNICLETEKELGRERNATLKGYQARTIDIDILFYNDAVIDNPNLTIPHPLLHERRFTLAPLNEILESFVHPVLKKTIGQLCLECKDNSQLIKI